MEEHTDLDRLAEAELLLEAKRGLARSNVFGPTGWKRCPLPGTNKKFLQNTIINAVSSNKLKEQNLGVKHSRDYHNLRIEHKLKHRSDSIQGNRKVKEKEKCDRTEKTLRVALKHKGSNSEVQHLNGNSLPKRKKSNIKHSDEDFCGQ